MAEKQLSTIIVLRNDKSTDWASSEVVLREGELGVSYLDNGNVMVKAGNGQDKWVDLPQVESVLESDMLLTYSFGKHTAPTGGFVNAGGKDMTMSQWIADSLKKTVEPTVKSYPSTSLTATCSNSGASLEIGSYITGVSYTGSLTDGSYDVNGKTVNAGLDNGDASWKVTLGDDAATEKTTRTGSYTTNIQINSTTANTVYATVKGTATLSVADVVVPTNNLGEARPNAKIKGFDANGTLTKTHSAEVKASGYRNTWYYVGTDCTTAIDSAFIRGTTAKNSYTTSFGTVTIPAGTTRVMFAVHGSHTLNSVIDVDGMGLDVKDNFSKKTIAVEGANGFEAANYTVFVAENSAGMAATKYTVSIS